MLLFYKNPGLHLFYQDGFIFYFFFIWKFSAQMFSHKDNQRENKQVRYDLTFVSIQEEVLNICWKKKKSESASLNDEEIKKWCS